MPRVAMRIPESQDSILRPVSFDVIRQVFDILSLPKDTSILFPGASEEAAMPGSTLNHMGEPTKFNNSERVRVEVNEEIEDHTILTTAVYQRENRPIFLDKDLGVAMYPVYAQTTLVFQLTYRAPNRVTAKRFRDECLLRHAAWRAENVHELTYHYPVPYEYIHLLQEIHTLREATAGYGEDFSKWVEDHFTNRVTNLTTLIGTQPQLSISEHQIRPLGWFDFNALPQPEQKEAENGTFVVNFEYRVVFDKVIGVAMEYPLVVHNALIDEKWYSSPRASGNFTDPERRNGVNTIGRRALDYFAQLNQCQRLCKIDGIRIPEFDDWEPKQVRPNTNTLALVMTAVDEEDPQAVINLAEIPDYAIEENVLAFLKQEHQWISRYGGNPFYVSLYRNDEPLDDSWLTVDENLNVRTTQPLNPRDRYHLRLALVNDLLSLSSEVLERFRLHGKACVAILSTLQWTMLRDGWTPKLLGGKYVTRRDLNEIAQRINDLKAPHTPGIEYPGMLTVGNFLITTHRRSDYARDAEETNGTGGDGALTGDGDRAPLQECDC